MFLTEALFIDDLHSEPDLGLYNILVVLQRGRLLDKPCGLFANNEACF